MQLEAELPRELGGLPHQLAGHRERGARRDRDLHPRARPRLVQRREAPRVVEDGIHRLDGGVRRQAALRLAEVHRAARRDEPDAELARGLELRLDQPLLATWEDVVVVEDGAAARERELGEAGARGCVLRLSIDARPRRVELASH